MTTTDDRHPATQDLRLVKVLAALADPVRVSIVRTLAGLGESPCVDLHHAAGLTISQPTFSHHQRVLRQAGVLRERVQGAQRIVSLRTGDLDACFPGLLTAVLETHPELVR
ncbi:MULTISPECIES: ArsR/SmtB family transcription factor [Kitasatospora]|uniref:ArsR/SmtB family transcription factor n=1 Tax=Kitasatospora TaxID=2063 RepID=UPI000C70588B|nr:metalloregulator ArsR/SmtB family transcription factor [Kitasatospora sp. GP30]MDH6143773.1 DNA-binding transcriptional ArsR family regulator [Kitasatospora sp. GP30]